MNNGTRLSGAGLALTSVVAWGGMFPVAKSILPTVNPFHMTLVRYVTASAILAGLLLAIEGRSRFSFEGRGLRLFWLGSSGFAGFSLFAFAGLRYTQSQNVSLIMAMMPLITVLVVAVQTRKRPPAYTIGTVAVALFGVSLVICKGDFELLLHGQVGRGDLLALAGAVCWVVYTRGGATFPGWSPLRYTTLTASLGSITIAAATAVATATGYVRTPSTSDFVAAAPQLLYLIAIAAVLAVFTWNLGIRRLGTQNGILFMNLVPVTTFTIEFLRGYRPGTLELAGAAVTVAALIANNLLARRSPAPTPVRLPATAQPAPSAA